MSAQGSDPHRRLARLQRHLGAAAVSSAETTWLYGGTGHEPLFEFAQREWCERAAAIGVALLEAADMTGVGAWALSEEYCQAPARLADAFAERRPVFWLLVGRDGRVSGGASVADEGFAVCRRTPGMHMAAQWAKGCYYAGMSHGPDGFAARDADFARLNDALTVACRPEPPHFAAAAAAATSGKPPFAPKAARSALRTLHNSLARIMRPSYEVLALPRTRIGVPNLGAMDGEQRAAFFALLQRPLRPVLGVELRVDGGNAKGNGGPTFLGLRRAQAGQHEFGDAPWCKACAEYGAGLLAAAGNELKTHADWAFSEEYTEAPARCLGGRTRAMYWIALRQGKVSCGWEDDIPAWVLRIKGFHVVAAWAAITGPSGAIYGTALLATALGCRPSPPPPLVHEVGVL